MIEDRLAEEWNEGVHAGSRLPDGLTDQELEEWMLRTFVDARIIERFRKGVRIVTRNDEQEIVSMGFDVDRGILLIETGEMRVP